MSHDDESTHGLLDQSSENVKILEIEESQVRSKREPVKMTGLLPYCFAFAVLVSFVYGVRYSATDKVFVNVEEEKTKENYTDVSDLLWTYDCIHNQCVRRLLNEGEVQINLDKCSFLCFRPSLWPKPKSVRTTTQTLSTFRKNLIKTKIDATKRVEEDLNQTIDLFMINLQSSERFWQEDVDLTNVFINIVVTSDIKQIHIDTDESYKLTINKISNYAEVNITAETYFGARHGLETLSQLILFDKITKKLYIYHDIEVQDQPAFAHRGLMIDTARNFFPVEQLLSVIDGMAINKLNVFHLHLTDSVSFPIVLPSNPWLAKFGAYGPDMVYRPEDIKAMVEYARLRGIRVILEIDAPSHANEGWNHLNTDTDKTIICGETNVFNGHLNPDSNKAQKLLESVYSDLLYLGTDTETFHIGGDEVNRTCLAQTMASRQFNDINEFWADYVNKIFKTVTKAFNGNGPKNLVIWSSDLTDWSLRLLKYTKNLVVQYWFGRLDPILSNGNKIIFSTVGKWYLDCGFGPWKAADSQGSCDPYTPWQTFYKYRPWQNYQTRRGQVLGGEACLWTEQVSVDALETRIWPRAAALAERLWSDVPKFDVTDVSTRLSDQSERLIKRGIKVAAVWPRWCSLNPGKCN